MTVRVRSERNALEAALIDGGLVTQATIDSLAADAIDGVALVDRLVAAGFVAEDQVAQTLADKGSVPFVAINVEELDAALVRRVPTPVLHRHRALPLLDDGRFVDVAFADPTDPHAISAIAAALNRRVRPAVATSAMILSALREIHGADADARGQAPRDDEAWEASGTLRFYSYVLRCVRKGIEEFVVLPTPSGGAVRLVGTNADAEPLSATERQALLARIKGLAGLPLEATGPCRHVLRSEIGGRALRVSLCVVPTRAGEAARVRLDPISDPGTLLSLPSEQVLRLTALLAKPNGLLVVNDACVDRAENVVEALLADAGMTAATAWVGAEVAGPSSCLGMFSIHAHGSLARALEAASFLSPDAFVVQPGLEEGPLTAALSLASGFRPVILVGTWKDARETRLGLRSRCAPRSLVNDALKAVVSLAPSTQVQFFDGDAGSSPSAREGR